MEEEQGEPLEDLLPRVVNERGVTGAAERLGVSKATLGYWLLRLGVRVETVALAPGESLEIVRRGASR